MSRQGAGFPCSAKSLVGESNSRHGFIEAPTSWIPFLIHELRRDNIKRWKASRQSPADLFDSTSPGAALAYTSGPTSYGRRCTESAHRNSVRRESLAPVAPAILKRLERFELLERLEPSRLIQAPSTCACTSSACQRNSPPLSIVSSTVRGRVRAMASSAALGAKVEAAIPSSLAMRAHAPRSASIRSKHSALGGSTRSRRLSSGHWDWDIPAARASASSSVVTSEPRKFRDNLGPCCSGAPG